MFHTKEEWMAMRCEGCGKVAGDNYALGWGRTGVTTRYRESVPDGIASWCPDCQVNPEAMVHTMCSEMYLLDPIPLISLLGTEELLEDWYGK